MLFVFLSFPLPFRVSEVFNISSPLIALVDSTFIFDWKGQDPAHVLTLGTLLLDQSQMVGSPLTMYRHG